MIPNEFDEGYDKGFAAGYDEGYEEGFAAGIKDIVANLDRAYGDGEKAALSELRDEIEELAVNLDKAFMSPHGKILLNRLLQTVNSNVTV